MNTILQKADEEEIKTIALPLISSGIFGGDPKVCSLIICEAISFYMESNQGSSCVDQV